MKGFIVSTSQRMINDRAHVLIFGRSDKGESFLTINHFQPYFFIKEADQKKALKFENFEYQKTKLKNFQDEKLLKILVDEPKEVSQLRHIFEEEGIECFEADIIYKRRFLIDNKLSGTIEVEGDFDYQEDVKVYRNPTLKPIESKIKLKVMSIDIETDPKAKRIFSIAIAQEKFEKVLVISDKKLKKAESFEDEEDLLERFFDIIDEQDPDIITGWNLIDFDLKVIRERCKKLHIPFTIGKGKAEGRLIIRKGFFQTSKAIAQGRQIIDLMPWIQPTVKLPDYRLETVAQHFVKEGKVKSVPPTEIEEYLKKSPQKVVDYNLQDAVLVLKILEKSDVLNLNMRRSIATGLLLDEVKGSISALDSLYLRRLRDRNYVAPSVKHTTKESQIMGGYVMESKPGIYENIIVLDFKSLYPSLMRTFNIDPLMFGKKGIKAPNGATFSKKTGVMPEILQELWDLREEYRKKKDEPGRYAIKILMNSFFGVMASPNCRFFNLELANSITGFAQMFVKKTAEMVKDKGYEVIYSDTDSVFIIAGKNPEKIGKQLAKELNITIQDFITKTYKIDSYLELEFEKAYTQFLMPKLRGSAKGAKKKYAGLVKGKLEITGLEAVRSDWTPLAKKFQKALLLQIFKKKEPTKFIQKFVEDLNNGKYDDLLVYKKRLRKELEDYAVNTPHKKAAMKLIKAKGKLKTTTISYIVTKDGPEPIEAIKNKPDYKHYAEKQIKPIADSLLTFFDTDFNTIIKNKNQKTLFNF
jgi:DNA polymerase II